VIAPQPSWGGECWFMPGGLGKPCGRPDDGTEGLVMEVYCVLSRNYLCMICTSFVRNVVFLCGYIEVPTLLYKKILYHITGLEFRRPFFSDIGEA
jgi:hypothetical protein